MSTPADKIIITITGDGYTLECYAASQQQASQTVEVASHGMEIVKYGDDLFAELPVELAAPLDAMDLNLLDAVIALMPDGA